MLIQQHEFQQKARDINFVEVGFIAEPLCWSAVSSQWKQRYGFSRVVVWYFWTDDGHEALLTRGLSKAPSDIKAYNI